MSDEKSLGVPEWGALGIPVDDFAEPDDAETPHGASPEDIERLVEGD